MKREYPLQQWQEIFRERRESGLTVKAWCTKREISENSYYYHLKKYRHAACSMLDSCQPAGLAEIPLETKHMVSHMQLSKFTSDSVNAGILMLTLYGR